MLDSCSYENTEFSANNDLCRDSNATGAQSGVLVTSNVFDFAVYKGSFLKSGNDWLV